MIIAIHHLVREAVDLRFPKKIHEKGAQNAHGKQAGCRILQQAAVEQGGSHRKRNQRGGSQPDTALEQISILERDDSHDSVAIPSLNYRTIRAYPEVNSSVETK